MRITTLLAVASFGLAQAASKKTSNGTGKLDPSTVGQDTSIVPNAWIVELDATEEIARLAKRGSWSRRKGDGLGVRLHANVEDSRSESLAKLGMQEALL